MVAPKVLPSWLVNSCKSQVSSDLTSGLSKKIVDRITTWVCIPGNVGAGVVGAAVVGVKLGMASGAPEGGLGTPVGAPEGTHDGALVGDALVGAALGTPLGAFEGAHDGALVGDALVGVVLGT